MTTTPPILVTYRDAGQEAGIVFIHGFLGDSQKTWGNFTDLLMSDRRIAAWDIFSLGYATGLAPDLRGIWSADPPIDSLADLLRTAVGLPPLNAYKGLAFIAHSMGGLILQRALVDNQDFTARATHIFLFGTPSAGLAKARWFRVLKRQVSDMVKGSRFIEDLRNRWTAKFVRGSLPFVFWTAAGDRDEFVPRTSSIDPFPKEQRAVVPGDHLEIVKPSKTTDLSLQLVLKGLIGDAAPAGPWNSARVAVESREFHRAVRLLEPHKGELDDQALVQLALALEGIGRQADAIKVLEEQGRSNTDAMGVLAGRLKRRWLVERRRADAERAWELYKKAFALAVKASDPTQAFYHGINVAFMELAYRGDHPAAKRMARKILNHCARAPQEKWRFATEGEAHLLLGETDAAIESYQQAIRANPTPREIGSMYQQAIQVATLVRDKSAVERLEAIFRGTNR